MGFQIADNINLFITGHPKRRFSNVCNGIIDHGLQHIANVIGENFRFLFYIVEHAAEYILHTKEIADILIDTE